MGKENKFKTKMITSQKKYEYNMESKVYKINNIEIAEENKEIKFLEEIKKDINKYIQYFDNIVLLAGAGASLVVDSNGKTDKNFGRTLKELSEDIVTGINESDKYYSINEIKNFLNYDKNKEFNLEDFLSRALVYKQFIKEKEDKVDKEKYDKTIEKIEDTIVKKTSYEYDVEKHKHGAVINNLSNMHKTPNRLSIVTTNYDVLFEQAAYKNGFIVFDGFTFSENPTFDPDIYNWSLSKKIENFKTDKVEYKKKVINLLKLHGSLTWEEENEKIIKKRKENVKKPIMIFPSSNKYMQSYKEPYFELFSKFQELLKIPNTLFITLGFSFADNHIATMIIQAVKENPTLTTVITSYNLDEEKNENWSNMIKLTKEGNRVIFLEATIDDINKYINEEKDDDR